MRTTASTFPREQFVSFLQTGGLGFNFRALNHEGVPLGLLCHFGLQEVHANLDGLHPGVRRVEITVHSLDARLFSMMPLARVSMWMDGHERHVEDLRDWDDYVHHVGYFYRPSATSFDWAFQPGCVRRDECARHLPLEQSYKPRLVTRELPNRNASAPARIPAFETPAHAIAD